MQHLLKQIGAWPFAGVLLAHDREPASDKEVGQQHPDHAEWERGVGCDIGHGGRRARPHGW